MAASVAMPRSTTTRAPAGRHRRVGMPARVRCSRTLPAKTFERRTKPLASASGRGSAGQCCASLSSARAGLARPRRVGQVVAGDGRLRSKSPRARSNSSISVAMPPAGPRRGRLPAPRSRASNSPRPLRSPASVSRSEAGWARRPTMTGRRRAQRAVDTQAGQQVRRPTWQRPQTQLDADAAGADQAQRVDARWMSAAAPAARSPAPRASNCAAMRCASSSTAGGHSATAGLGR